MIIPVICEKLAVFGRRTSFCSRLLAHRFSENLAHVEFSLPASLATLAVCLNLATSIQYARLWG